jgi:hypothetical protein
MPKAKKRNRVKGVASRGRGKKCILIVLVILLLIPAMPRKRLRLTRLSR